MQGTNHRVGIAKSHLYSLLIPKGWEQRNMKIAKKSSLFTEMVQRFVIQQLISVKTFFRSSQVFTGLHGKVNYFRLSQPKSENDKT